MYRSRREPGPPAVVSSECDETQVSARRTGVTSLNIKERARILGTGHLRRSIDQNMGDMDSLLIHSAGCFLRLFECGKDC
jgi:hypothetical protein